MERDLLASKFKQSNETAHQLKDQNTKIERQLAAIQSQAEIQVDETKKLF